MGGGLGEGEMRWEGKNKERGGKKRDEQNISTRQLDRVASTRLNELSSVTPFTCMIYTTNSCIVQCTWHRQGLNKVHVRVPLAPVPARGQKSRRTRSTPSLRRPPRDRSPTPDLPALLPELA